MGRSNRRHRALSALFAEIERSGVEEELCFAIGFATTASGLRRGDLHEMLSALHVGERYDVNSRGPAKPPQIALGVPPIVYRHCLIELHDHLDGPGDWRDDDAVDTCVRVGVCAARQRRSRRIPSGSVVLSNPTGTRGQQCQTQALSELGRVRVPGS